MAAAENGRDESCDNARIVTQIVDDFKGQSTTLLDMRSITAIVDYFVITSAGSGRQMKAMAEECDRVMKSRGQPKLGAEGDDGDSVWLLRDYGDVVLHVFTEEGRELYDLEGLWADAISVDWQSSEAAAGDA